jgi:hypothetical protein
VEVRELAESEYGIWDDLVKNSPHGTIFHRSAWLQTCSNSLGKQLEVYGCFEREDLIGGCSVFVDKSWLFRSADSNAAMTPYGGLILRPPASSDVRREEARYGTIVGSLLEIFEEKKFDRIRIANSPEFLDIRPFTWNGWQGRVYYTYYLDLTGAFAQNISKSARWSVRKGITSNLVIRKLQHPDAESYYRMFSMTFQRQNLKPPVGVKFLQSILEMLDRERAGEVWTAETVDGDLACAEIVIWDEKRAYRWSAASSSNLRNTGATSLLLVEIFTDLKERGFKEVNLMAANTPHLSRFIAGFNPRLVPYYCVERKTAIAETIDRVRKTLKKP